MVSPDPQLFFGMFEQSEYILPASVMYIIMIYQNFSTFITAISACILVCKCVNYTMYVDMFK